MNTQLIQDFESYANSFKHGHLKHWKASGILWQIRDFPDIVDDEVRFLKFLNGSLGMEGFLGVDVELIMGWLYERKAEITA